MTEPSVRIDDAEWVAIGRDTLPPPVWRLNEEDLKMTISDLVPWARRDRSSDLRMREPERGGSSELTPFFRLHDEMNRLFEDAFRAFDAPAAHGPWPSVEMQETDDGYRI